MSSVCTADVRLVEAAGGAHLCAAAGGLLATECLVQAGLIIFRHRVQLHSSLAAARGSGTRPPPAARATGPGTESAAEPGPAARPRHAEIPAAAGLQQHRQKCTLAFYMLDTNQGKIWTEIIFIHI